MRLNEVDNAATRAVYACRWVLFPLNAALLLALLVYVGIFLRDAGLMLLNVRGLTLEACMVLLLGFVDAAMVANLILMIIQGSHQIFIQKLDTRSDHERPQWLDHIDSGILKVKVALSIAGITLVQLLRDFANLERVEWVLVVHRAEIHGVALVSALVMAVIWRVTHPQRGTHA